MSIKDRIGKLFGGGSREQVVQEGGTTPENQEPDAKITVPDVSAEPAVAAGPAVAEIEVKPVTSEVATVPGQDKGRPPGEEPKAEDEVVETIPLGEDEERSLYRNKYEQNKARFPRRFLIEKDFWMHASAADPQKPNQIVKVKRVVELRAGSLLHALKLIGWDKTNVRLVKESDDYKGEVGVLIDGKLVCTYKLPPLPDGQSFESMGGGKRKEYVRLAKDAALAEPKVQEALTQRKRVVTGWAFEPKSHIRLSTSRAPKGPGSIPIPGKEEIKDKEAVMAREDKAVSDAIAAVTPGQETDGASKEAPRGLKDLPGVPCHAEPISDAEIMEAISAGCQRSAERAAEALGVDLASNSGEGSK